MRNLTNSQYKNFKTMCRLTQTQLSNLLVKFLRKKNYDVIATEDYIIGIGDIPIALVAHMDTVFVEEARDIYYDKEQSIMWSPQGLGADDRAGIFAITEILREGYKPHVIFTTDEEVGCIGAQKLVHQMPEKPFEMKYMVQLDRRGSVDCVFYDMDDEKFEQYIASFGFVPAVGTFSDISVIAPKWGVGAVNLSVGYKNEHTTSETLNIHNLLETIDKVKQMLLSAETAPTFEFVSPYSLGFWDEFYSEECDFCKKSFYPYEVILALTADGQGYVGVCPDCVVGRVNWCTECKEAYVKNPNQKKAECPACKAKKKKGDKITNEYFKSRVGSN